MPSLQHKKAFSKSAVDVFVLNSDAVRLVHAHVSLEFKHLTFLNFEYPWHYNVWVPFVRIWVTLYVLTAILKRIQNKVWFRRTLFSVLLLLGVHISHYLNDLVLQYLRLFWVQKTAINILTRSIPFGLKAKITMHMIVLIICKDACFVIREVT